MHINTPVELGDVAKDRITGFKGVVISITKWMNGCVRLQLQPQELREGKPIETQSFDVEQIVLVKSAKPALASPTGGPKPQPTRNADPTR